ADKVVLLPFLLGLVVRALMAAPRRSRSARSCWTICSIDMAGIVARDPSNKTSILFGATIPGRGMIMSTGVVLAPEHAELQKKAIVANLKSEIFCLWFHHLENRYWIGKKLCQLQQLHGKPGSGTFLEDVDELDIPRSTAYRYITFYPRIRAGFDPTPLRLSRSEKDKLLATVEGPNEDDSTLEMNADQERAKVAEATRAAKRHPRRDSLQRCTCAT